MKKSADEHGGRDVGEHGLIRQWRRCRTETEEVWDDGYGKMGWKNSNGLGKYQHVMTTDIRAYCRSDDLGVRSMMDLYGNLGCIWRLCVSYCNL